MKKKTYLIIAVIMCVVAVIGLLSFIGGIRPMNAGAFLFPALIAVWAFIMYRKR